jgi:hypothetical protein
LGESDAPDYMGIVGRVAAVVVPALSDTNALLAMLPVILLSASADVVRSVLELLVALPDEGPVSAVLDDASRCLDDVINARPTFAQP